MTLEEAKNELEKFVKLKTTMRPAFLDVILKAEPIRHRKWIWVEDVPLEDGKTEYDREAWYQCSECEAYDLRLKDCHADYCWSCGAKMDEVNDEAEDT